MVTPEEKPLKEKKELKKKTFKEKLIYIKENVTVEPVLTGYVVSAVIARLATQNLNLDKACRLKMQYGDEICDALIARKGDNLFKKEELAIQGIIAGMESWKNLLLTAIPSFLILFLGAWSDRTGQRKIIMLLPIIAELFVCLSNILSTYYFYEISLEVTVFFEAFFPAITGGWVAMYLGAYAYVSDITTEETRTFRLGVVSLCMTMGGPVGSLLSGVLLNKIGYYGVFSLSAVLFLISILYGFFCIKDPERISSGQPNQNQSSGVRGFLKTFFDIKHVKDTFHVVFKKGPNHRRTKSILVLASIVFIYGPALGEHLMRYMYTRYRFNWDALKYSFYNTVVILMHSLGALISISLFSHRLKWHDSVLGLISNVSKIAGALATALARNSRDMYIAVVIEMFNATSFTALRSISSKLCNSDELGKMTSFFNLVEVATSMLFGPLYSMIYQHTIKINPGIMYYVSTVLTVPPLVIFGMNGPDRPGKYYPLKIDLRILVFMLMCFASWFYIQHRKSLRESRNGDLEYKTTEIELVIKKEEQQLLDSKNIEQKNIGVEQKNVEK